MKTAYQIVAFLLMIALTVLGISGCDNSGESNFEEAYVLQGFMALGQRIAVRLTRTIDIDQYYDEAAVGVPGATVTIWESLDGDTTAYVLIEDSTQLPGTYLAPEIDDTVKVRYDYAIRIEINDHVITAITKQAPPPFRLDSCKIGSRLIQNPTDAAHPPTVIYDGDYYELFYQAPAWGAGVMMVIENLQPDWYSNDDLQVSGNNGPDQSNSWIWSLRQGTSFQVPRIILGFQGQHRVRAMTCDTAAYDYFLTAQPGNPENRPPSNVVGGLGLFSIYDADTVYFCLTDPEADVAFQCQP